MKKNIIEVLITFIVIFFVGYLMCSFITWEINPRMWSEDVRSTFVLLSLLAATAIVFIDRVFKSLQ